MEDQWDGAVNVHTLTDAQRRERVNEEMRQHWQQIGIERENRRVSMGYFTLPVLTEREVDESFPWHRSRRYANSYDNTMWSANRLQYVCHNCGTIGFKSSLHELFKCYCCRSRNVTVCRAGDISKLIRGDDVGPIGVNMENIFRERQERRRRRNGR